MNLYLLSQTKNTGYDTYDSCVVVAATEEAARFIHPYDGKRDNWWIIDDWTYSDWAKPEQVDVKLIGTADASLQTPGVICASFNAG